MRQSLYSGQLLSMMRVEREQGLVAAPVLMAGDLATNRIVKSMWEIGVTSSGFGVKIFRALTGGALHVWAG